MLNLINKKDFVDSVHASMSLDDIRHLSEAPNTPDERLKTVMLTVMVWANNQRQATGNSLYMYFRSVAQWIKMSYEDHLLSGQETIVLLSLGIDPLLELVWETTQEARGEHREVLDYLHDHLVTGETP